LSIGFLPPPSFGLAASISKRFASYGLTGVGSRD
jgi:hypothetical protein